MSCASFEAEATKAKLNFHIEQRDAEQDTIVRGHVVCAACNLTTIPLDQYSDYRDHKFPPNCDDCLMVKVIIKPKGSIHTYYYVIARTQMDRCRTCKRQLASILLDHQLSCRDQANCAHHTPQYVKEQRTAEAKE